MDNPVAGIIQLMQSEGARFNPPTIGIGEIVTVTPLTIRVGDLVLDKDDFMVSDILVDGYKRTLAVKSTGEITNSGTVTITGTLTSSTQNASGGSGDDSFASHNHGISGDATLTGEATSTNEYTLTGETVAEFKPYLQIGDLLAVMPFEDRQKYLVLCKVVSL